jgi:uncharacterized membrane protein YfcA
MGFGAGAWAVMALAGVIMGFSKTSIGNVGLLGVVLLAQVLPVKDSTGVALLLLLVGDAVATVTYRKSVDWKLIARLILPVAVGLGVGAFFLHIASDSVLKKTIGAVILALLLLGLRPDKLGVRRRAVAAGYGGLAGFTTMVANAGGSAMSLYLLASKFDKIRFIATSAWFFAAINLTKLPISIGLGIIRPDTALVALPLAPAVLVGTVIGRLVLKRLKQKTFNRLVMVFVAVSAIYLMVS